MDVLIDECSGADGWMRSLFYDSSNGGEALIVLWQQCAENDANA
jgi:hypothetical protein